MLVSPHLPLAVLLLLLPSSVVDCADSATQSAPQQVLPWPAFDPKKCEDGTSVFCLLPSDTGNKLKLYTNVEPYTPKETQVILRFYNGKKILVEIWSEGSSVELNTKQGIMFGCKVSNGKVIVKSEAESTLISEENTPDAFYCRFTLTDDEEIFPYPKEDNSEEPITLKNSQTYDTTRGELQKLTLTKSRCDFNLVKNKATLTDDGYIMNEIPYDLLFAKSITCPANSVLMVEQGSGSKKTISEARAIFCENKIENGEKTKIFLWEKKTIEDNEQTFENQSITQSKAFKAGCKFKVCDLCSDPSFECQKDGCELPAVQESIDNCKVYKCPQSFMEINDETTPVAGEIHCSQEGKDKFGWAFNGKPVKKASCPKALRCADVSPLKCADDKEESSCTELNQSPSVVMCKNKQPMRIRTADGEKNVTSLACNQATGRYKMQIDNEPDLPEGAIINCTAVKHEEGSAEKKNAEPATGKLTLYVAVGSTVLLIGIVLVIIVLCCLRRMKQRKDAAKLPATTTTKTTVRTTKTMSGESKTPARTVPIPPPTPIAAPLQRAEADVKPWEPNLTERTPNAPTPLVEQRTQDQPTDRREKSKTKSLPMAEPPTPKAETAQPEGEDSKSGVESTKTKMREDVTFKRVEEEEPPNNHHLIQVKRKRASSHHDRSTHPSQGTQGEESTKRTQKDSKTKTKTQRTQDMRTDEAAAANEEAPRIPARPPPKKVEYKGLNEVEKDSFDSEETKKSPLGKGPMKAPAKTPIGEQNPYLKLEDYMSEHEQKKKKKEKEEKKKIEKDGSVMLITQESEESMKKTKK